MLSYNEVEKKCFLSWYNKWLDKLHQAYQCLKKSIEITDCDELTVIAVLEGGKKESNWKNISPRNYDPHNLAYLPQCKTLVVPFRVWRNSSGESFTVECCRSTDWENHGWEVQLFLLKEVSTVNSHLCWINNRSAYKAAKSDGSSLFQQVLHQYSISSPPNTIIIVCIL